MEKTTDKRFFVRMLATAAAAALMLVCMSVSVSADDAEFLPEGVDYTTVDENGNTSTEHLSRDQFKIIGIDTPADDIKMEGPQTGEGQWYVVYGGGTIFHRIEVEGVVNLLLMNETELECKQGFHVRRGNNYTETLNIYAQGTNPDLWGKLKATGGAGQAAIGANRTVDIVERGGTVSIYGGRIEVSGGAAGAGIGGGQGLIPASGTRYGGDAGIFRLYGGQVNANGGPSAAAIGGGMFGNSGTITIYGGSLDARGGKFGAGIGGGRNMELAADYEHGGSAENVTIKGGTVRAYGGEGAAGIGAGLAANGSAGRGYDSEADKKWIKVEGGDVYAEGGEGGAGIGGGIYKDNEYYENGAGANVMISGGRVTARGGAEAAGIGATRSKNCGSGDTIIKGNAKVTAYGGDYAAGIGTGNEPMGLAGNTKWNKVYNIQISEQAEVTAFGGKEAAGIGAGNEGQPSASVRANLKISGDAKVEAYGGKYGAGIGGGDKNNNGITEISGGTVIATGGEGGAGIGGGDNAGGSAGKVTISGGIVKANGGYKAAGIGGGNTADMKCELEVTGGKVTATAGEKAAGIGGGNHTFWSGGGNGGTVKVNLADSSAEAEDYVFAISGNDSSSPIGHGDAGDSLGNLTIGDRMSVKASAGDNYDKYDTVNAIKPETHSERINVTHNEGTMSALIQYCKHKEAKYTYLDAQKHRVRCPSCGLDEEEDHTPGDGQPCTKCNFEGDVWTVTLKEGINGTYESSIRVARTHSTDLPDCDKDRIPEGREFVGWVTESNNVNDYDFDNLSDEQKTAVRAAISAAKKAGSEVTPTADTTYYALYIPEATISFDPGDGSGTMSPRKAVLFSSVKLPNSTFTPPEGKEFDKWTIDGSEYAAGADYSAEQTSVQLTATWKDHIHNFDYEGGHHDAVAPTCLEDGCVEFWKCKTCERYYADEQGTKEIAESDIELSPTGHNYDAATYTWSDDNSKVTAKQVCLNDPEHQRGETVDSEEYVEKAASCAEEGTTYYYAQFSNPVFKLQSKKVTTPRTAHTWGDWGPDPDDAGKEIRSCTVCGAIEERAAGHEHTMEHHSAVAPQCEKQGKKEYWSCEGCGKLYADDQGNQEIDEGSLGIPAVGHKYVATESSVLKPAECEENGVLRVKKVCEHDSSHTTYEFPDIPPLGHDWNNGVVKKAASCTEAGEKEYVCLNDPSHTRTDIIAPLGHEWTEWSSVTEGSIKYKQRECTRCGETQRIADEDTGCAHTAETVPGKPATCEEGGLKDHYVCSVCGVYLKKNDDDTYSPVSEDEIDAYLDDLVIGRLGHEWNDPEYIWSADSSSVTARVVCKRDADHRIEEQGSVSEKVTKEPTETEDGEKIVTATFTNDYFRDQEKKVVLPKKGTPAQPEAPKVTTKARTSARTMKVKWTVEWGKVAGAKRYKVAYRKAGSSKWTYKTTKKTKYKVKGHKLKGLYEYKVAAVTSSGEIWSRVSCRYFKGVKTKVKSRKGGVKISWKKDKTASGYQVQIASNKKMKNAQTIELGSSSRSHTFSGLKKGKKYYVRVRPLKEYNGVIYKGILSKPKKAKAK